MQKYRHVIPKKSYVVTRIGDVASAYVKKKKQASNTNTGECHGWRLWAWADLSGDNFAASEAMEAAGGPAARFAGLSGAEAAFDEFWIETFMRC